MPSIVFMYFIEMEMQRKRKNTHSNMINKPKVQQKKEKKKKKKSFWHCDALSVYIQGGSLLFSKCGFPELILKT